MVGTHADGQEHILLYVTPQRVRSFVFGETSLFRDAWPVLVPGWHHIALQGVEGERRLLIDGQREATWPVEGQIASATRPLVTLGASYWIRLDGTITAAQFGFIGRLSRLRVSDVANRHLEPPAEWEANPDTVVFFDFTEPPENNRWLSQGPTAGAAELQGGLPGATAPTWELSP